MAGVISGLLRFKAEEDYKNAAGQIVVRAGETVVIAPQTLAGSVIMADGQTLAQALAALESSLSSHTHSQYASTNHSHSDLAKAGHTHADYETVLAGYQTQLARLANRLTGAGF